MVRVSVRVSVRVGVASSLKASTVTAVKQTLIVVVRGLRLGLGLGFELVARIESNRCQANTDGAGTWSLPVTH